MDTIIGLLISVVLGALSGWLAGKIMKSEGSLLRNVILGIIGGFVGGFIFDLLGISFGGYLGTVVISVVGACLVIFVANKLLKK